MTPLLGAEYKEKIFDPSAKTRPPECEGGNFDITQQTEEKVSAIRPIMRPSVLQPLLNEFRANRKTIRNQAINAFHPRVATPSETNKDEQK